MRTRLVEKPLRLTLRELIADFDQVICPITLVCAGNRRKEQNVVRKTKGFSWGAAGVSTALWTGVMMSEVLRAAKPTKRARYVCMEGADKLVGHRSRLGASAMRLTPAAQRILRDVRQAQLGDGSKSRYDAGVQDERGSAQTRSRKTVKSSHPRPNRWSKREVAEENHRYGCPK